MFKRLLKCVREYKLPTFLTLFFIVGEAMIECMIPFITAELINRIEDGAGMDQIVQTGLVLVVMAVLSLCCGGVAAVTCAKASAGFAKNLRKDLFYRIQDCSCGCTCASSPNIRLENEHDTQR